MAALEKLIKGFGQKELEQAEKEGGSKNDETISKETDSFSLNSWYSFFSNWLWTSKNDAPAETSPLLSGKNISLRDKR